MTSSGGITELLSVALMAMLAVLFILFCVYLFVLYKEKKKKEDMKKTFGSNAEHSMGNKKGTIATEYSRQSILDFMEFDKIEDNMVVQRNGERFLMVVECQGVNYDLMSTDEKNSVEAGFLQFLNTLRYPVQIYTQTRTVNLENSISTYKNRIKQYEDKLNKMKFEYSEMVKSGNYNKEELDKQSFEIKKQANLYEYGKDVVYNTERMSLNKNVLNKQYYVIIPYYSADLGNSKFDKEEIRNYSFSELYTRAQSIIRTLSICGISGRIMASNDIVELLYIAYNRDEAEVFGLKKAMKAGYDELYSTAEEVLDKQMKALDKQIEEKATEKVNDVIMQVRSEKQNKLEEKEESIEDLISDMAKLILEENRMQIGEEVTDEAIEKIDTEAKSKKGGVEDGEKKTTRTRRVKRAV